MTATKGVDIQGLQWLERYRDSLLGIQQQPDGSLAAVRIRLDRRGRRAQAVEVIGPAASRAATVMSGVFYYLESREGSRVVRAVRLQMNGRHREYTSPPPPPPPPYPFPSTPQGRLERRTAAERRRYDSRR